MTQAFDKDYWESHWRQADQHAPGQEILPNPYLAREIVSLIPGTALDAGCGEGAEATWLATVGWRVTAADISAEALSRASERATKHGAAPECMHWVEADLSIWEPGMQFDVVTTHYAHPAMPQLAFYRAYPAGWHRAAPCSSSDTSTPGKRRGTDTRRKSRVTDTTLRTRRRSPRRASD